MKLSKLLERLDIRGEYKDVEISDVIYDSRKVVSGCLFVCLRGSSSDGHAFACQAAERGAAAIIAEENVEADAQVLLVESTRKALALTSAAFFGYPAETAIKTIGITGTKGKTTTSCMVRAILESAGHKTGIIGTLGVIIGDEIIKTENTTPASYEIQKYFRQMADSGCKYCVMEASSIGLRDLRIYGFMFDVGIYTNFSEDHIGGVEHKDMDEYLNSKNMLFRLCKKGIINIDDTAWERMIENHSCEVKTYGFSEKAEMRAGDYHLLIKPGFLGISFAVSGTLDFTAEVAIPGRFNAYNALAAIACCHELGISSQCMNKGLSSVRVKGRVEPVPVQGNYTLLIDYAHNAVSMENILEMLREYNPARLVCLFGAGGNRPKVRRYEMGEVCGRMADLSVITADNSRFENALDIIEDIKIGMKRTDGQYVEIPDRKEAIRYCIENARDGDIILLAGKGHEDYQEIEGVKYHMDEREIVADILKLKKHK